ncbi:MAG: glycosyltransferase family 2 protein [Fusobacteriaceae bacterium]|nr:glycosyltransferase family 2 protein [Fusobacteriaceae bacterium]
MVKVSICIPTYNNSKVLERLLKSVFEQDYKDFEIIITDNSDNESVLEIASKYSCSQLFYIKNEKNIGAVPNWNKLLSLANGEYIKFMFADDWFSFKNSLSKFVDMIEKTKDCSFAFSGTHQVSLINSYSRSIEEYQEELLLKDYRTLFTGNWIGAPSATIFKRDKIYFDDNLKWVVDLEFYIRYLTINNSINYTKEPLISIGINDSQITNDCVKNKALNNFEYSYVYKKLGLESHYMSKRYLTKLLVNNDEIKSKISELGLLTCHYHYYAFKRAIKNILRGLFK